MLPLLLVLWLLRGWHAACRGIVLQCLKGSTAAFAPQDGFPPSLTRQNGFQRHATLLIYLNTTTQVRPLQALMSL
jgi:hypothetical protein